MSICPLICDPYERVIATYWLRTIVLWLVPYSMKYDQEKQCSAHSLIVGLHHCCSDSTFGFISPILLDISDPGIDYDSEILLFSAYPFYTTNLLSSTLYFSSVV